MGIKWACKSHIPKPLNHKNVNSFFQAVSPIQFLTVLLYVKVSLAYFVFHPMNFYSTIYIFLFSS